MIIITPYHTGLIHAAIISVKYYTRYSGFYITFFKYACLAKNTLTEKDAEIAELREKLAALYSS